MINGKDKDMVAKNILITKEQENYLLTHYSTVSRGMRICIDKAIIRGEDPATLLSIRSKTKEHFKGYFSKDEWKCLIDRLRHVITPSQYRCNSKMLHAHIEDSNFYNSIQDEWGVDYKLFCEKILKLSPAEVDCTYWIIETFWDSNKGNLLDYIEDL